jgi:glycosyltransferase involved in cell wall biosynthesis
LAGTAAIRNGWTGLKLVNTAGDKNQKRMGTGMENSNLKELVKGKRVLYIATKNLDYLRIQQEINLVNESGGSLTVLGSKDKKYVPRLKHVLPGLFRVKKRDFDVIFIGFLPQIILPFFSFLFRGKCMIIDFFISMYDTMAFDRQRFKPGSLPARFLRWVDMAVLKRADHIIVDTKTDGEYFIRELNADPSKIEVLYLEADTSIYYPREVKKLPHIQDKFVVLYFGSILPLQGVEVIAEAANMLKDHPELYFVIIGPVGKELKDRSASYNIEFIDWLKQEDLAEYIAMSDLCLAGHFNSRIDKARRTIAGKTYIYQAMGKPVILGENAANRELYEEDNKTVFYTQMGDPSDLKDTIVKAWQVLSKEVDR